MIHGRSLKPVKTPRKPGPVFQANARKLQQPKPRTDTDRAAKMYGAKGI